MCAAVLKIPLVIDGNDIAGELDARIHGFREVSHLDKLRFSTLPVQPLRGDLRLTRNDLISILIVEVDLNLFLGAVYLLLRVRLDCHLKLLGAILRIRKAGVDDLKWRFPVDRGIGGWLSERFFRLLVGQDLLERGVNDWCINRGIP